MDLFLDFIQIFRRIMIILAQNKVCFCFSLHCLLNKSVILEKKCSCKCIMVCTFLQNSEISAAVLESPWKALEWIWILRLEGKFMYFKFKTFHCHFCTNFLFRVRDLTPNVTWTLMPHHTLCLISWVTNYYTTTTTWEISLIWLVKSSGITA